MKVSTEFTGCLHASGDFIIGKHYPHNHAASEAFDIGWKEGFLALQKEKTSHEDVTRIAEQAVACVQRHEHAHGVGLCLGALANMATGKALLLIEPVFAPEDKFTSFRNFFRAFRLCTHNDYAALDSIANCITTFYKREIAEVFARDSSLSKYMQIANTNETALHYCIHHE